VSNSAHAFPDANVFLHFAALDGLDWCKLCQTDEVIVHITQPLLTELNKNKELASAKLVRKRASTVQRRLSELLDTYGVVAPLTSEVKIVFEDRSPDLRGYPGLNASISDDLLVAAVLDFSSQSKDTAILVTDDNGLGLIAKAAKWKLTTLKPPESARLPEEPDEEKKEIERLRQKVTRLESAMPAPKLLFSNGASVVGIDPENIDLESTVKAAVDHEKKKHPRLPEPKNPHQKLSKRMTVGELAPMHLSYAELLMNDPKEVKKYNAALDKYFAEFERATRVNLQIRQRLVRLELQVDNRDGSAPALDVLVQMHFPDGFQVIEKANAKKTLQRLPEAPLLPGYFRGLQDPLASFAALSHLPRPIDPNAPTLSIRKTKSYDVRWRVPKLRQGHIYEVDPIYVLFDSAPFSFHLDYWIVADNLSETVTGQLHVVAP